MNKFAPERPDVYTIFHDGEVYLRRRYVCGRRSQNNFPRAKTRWGWLPFTIYEHLIELGDTARHLHNHPWWALSFILKGTYLEYLMDGGRVRHRWSLRLLRPNTYHRIELVSGAVHTLFITGPKCQEWGFHIPAKEYHGE